MGELTANPRVPNAPSIRLGRRIVATCGTCLVTLRAPRLHPEIDAFKERHLEHGNGHIRSTEAHASLWTTSDENDRLKAELEVATKRLAAQRVEISRLHTKLEHASCVPTTTPKMRLPG